jgi:hypothetical protein
MLPSNVTKGQYIRFVLASMVSMFAGSQLVHNIFKPLKDLDKFVEKELENLPEDQRKKVKELL